MDFDLKKESSGCGCWKILMAHFILCACLFNLTHSVFDTDLKPLAGRIDYGDLWVQSLPRFTGQKYYEENDRNNKWKDQSQDPNFRIMLPAVDKTYMIVGARNYIFLLPIMEGKLFEKEALATKLSVDDDTMIVCVNARVFKEENPCHNYISVILHHMEQVLVCGTNAFRPQCRLFNANFSTSQDYNNRNIYLPPRPSQINSAYSTGSLVFSATATLISGTESNLFRTSDRFQDLPALSFNTRLSRTPIPIHHSASFVYNFAYGPHVFLVFREPAEEMEGIGKVVYSRVGRVCANDKGGMTEMMGEDEYWSSFNKARLNCSIPGDYPFYFDEVQDADFVTLKDSPRDDETSLLVAVFNTPINSIGGSAICIYSISQIKKSFSGHFYPQKSYTPEKDRNKYYMYDLDPNTCPENSRTVAPSRTTFIRENPLMDQSISPGQFSGLAGPVFTLTRKNYRLTRIKVDVISVGTTVLEVMFVGTNNGKLLKIVHDPMTKVTKWIDEIQIFPKEESVTNLQLVGENIYLSSDKSVVKVARQRCDTLHTCSWCVGSQDPYCYWDYLLSTCSSKSLLQDISQSIPVYNNRIESICGTNLTTSYEDHELCKCNDVDCLLCPEIIKQAVLMPSPQINSAALEQINTESTEDMFANSENNQQISLLVVLVTGVACLFVGMMLGFVTLFVVAKFKASCSAVEETKEMGLHNGFISGASNSDITQQIGLVPKSGKQGTMYIPNRSPTLPEKDYSSIPSLKNSGGSNSPTSLPRRHFEFEPELLQTRLDNRNHTIGDSRSKQYPGTPTARRMSSGAVPPGMSPSLPRVAASVIQQAPPIPPKSRGPSASSDPMEDTQRSPDGLVYSTGLSTHEYEPTETHTLIAHPPRLSHHSSPVKEDVGVRKTCPSPRVPRSLQPREGHRGRCDSKGNQVVIDDQSPLLHPPLPACHPHSNPSASQNPCVKPTALCDKFSTFFPKPKLTPQDAGETSPN